MSKKKRSKQKSEEFTREPWISSRTGLAIIAALSVAIAFFTGKTIYPIQGMMSAVLWGLGSAVGLWVFFGAAYLFNRILHGR